MNEVREESFESLNQELCHSFVEVKNKLKHWILRFLSSLYKNISFHKQNTINTKTARPKHFITIYNCSVLDIWVTVAISMSPIPDHYIYIYIYTHTNLL